MLPSAKNNFGIACIDADRKSNAIPTDRISDVGHRHKAIDREDQGFCESNPKSFVPGSPGKNIHVLCR